jgi:hypothetical protein
MVDMERLFITKENMEYKTFIQNRIDVLLKKKGWTFKVSDHKKYRNPYDDLIVMNNNGEDVGSLSGIQGTYPYKGNRRLLNELEKLANQKQTDGEDAYEHLTEEDREQNKDIRTIHEGLQTVIGRLRRYRSDHFSTTITDAIEDIPNHAIPTAKPIHSIPVTVCGAMTRSKKKCRRVRPHGKNTCHLH